MKMPKGSKSLTFNQRRMRFWDRVDNSKHDGCWNWTGGHCGRGYGAVSNELKKQTPAHRVSWMLTYGYIPDGLFVLHACDNRSCCNPAHLHLGTGADNLREMVERGRSLTGDRHPARLHPETRPRGVNHPRAKLTNELVCYIRSSGRPDKAMGRELGVSNVAVRAARIRETWKHVTDDEEAE